MAFIVPLAIQAAAVAQANIPCRYEVAHIIQAPFMPGWGFPTTVGHAISPSGRYVCGHYGAFFNTYLFLYDTQTSTFQPLPFQDDNFISANDVNDEYVVGQFQGYGFLYKIATGEVTTLLPAVPPEVGTCSVNAINSSNVVCGTRTIQASPHRTTAFRWSAEKGFDDLGLIDGLSTSGEDINDLNVVAGRRGTGSSTYRGIVWQENAVTQIDTLNELATIAFALNNSTEVVGRSDVATAQPHAFHWVSGEIVDLGTLPGHSMSFGNDISVQGTIAGISRPSTGADVAVIWTFGGISDLNGLLQPKSDFWLRSANAIANDESLIAGAASATLTFVALLKPIFPSLGDITEDCQVDVDDLFVVIDEWGNTDSIADLNHDEVVNVQDLLLVIGNWTFE